MKIDLEFDSTSFLVSPAISPKKMHTHTHADGKVHSYTHEAEDDQQNTSQPAKIAQPITVPDKKKLGRNDPCWCGSGKKYKKCHYPN